MSAVNAIHMYIAAPIVFHIQSNEGHARAPPILISPESSSATTSARQAMGMPFSASVKADCSRSRPPGLEFR